MGATGFNGRGTHTRGRSLDEHRPRFTFNDDRES